MVIAEKSKFIKPVDTAILSMVPESDPDLTTYVNELFRTNKLKQQNNLLWFPPPKNPGKTENYKQEQIRMVKKKHELRKTWEIKPKNGTKSQTKLTERFDWTHQLLARAEKQPVEDILKRTLG